MEGRKLEILIKENWDGKDGSLSTVGVRFASETDFRGDYERFHKASLTDEEIADAVKKLLMKLLPMVEKKEEPKCKEIPYERCKVVCKVARTPDGKWVKETV